MFFALFRFEVPTFQLLQIFLCGNQPNFFLKSRGPFSENGRPTARPRPERKQAWVLLSKQELQGLDQFSLATFPLKLKKSAG